MLWTIRRQVISKIHLLQFNLSKHLTTLLSIHMTIFRTSDYCWPKALWLKPPRVYFFEASCKLHDDWYWEGWNEWRRLVCDLFFYTHMINDINKFCRWFFHRVFYFCWATVYFLLVRLFGWTCFKYTNKYDWTNLIISGNSPR